MAHHREAHVILPSLLWYEQEGSTYNLEGRRFPSGGGRPSEGLIPENEVFTSSLPALVMKSREERLIGNIGQPRRNR